MHGFPDSAYDLQFPQTEDANLSLHSGGNSWSCWDQSVSAHAAYHPSANGLIERFHRQLKASLKAQLQPTSWVDALPLVLLGIRTPPKQDIHCGAAELVYGTTLCLPGEFFNSDHSLPVADPAEYVT